VLFINLSYPQTVAHLGNNHDVLISSPTSKTLLHQATGFTVNVLYKLSAFLVNWVSCVRFVQMVRCLLVTWLVTASCQSTSDRASLIRSDGTMTRAQRDVGSFTTAAARATQTTSSHWTTVRRHALISRATTVTQSPTVRIHTACWLQGGKVFSTSSCRSSLTEISVLKFLLDFPKMVQFLFAFRVLLQQK